LISRSAFRFNPTELVITGYLTLTGFYILFNLKMLNQVPIHLWARMVIFILIALLAFLQNRWAENNMLKFLRFFFPLMILGYLYHETDYMNNLIFTKNLDPIFSRSEKWIFGMQPALVFAARYNTSWFAEIMYFAYFSYYLMLVSIPIYFYSRKQFDLSLQTIFIVVNSLLIFYVIFIILPVAGPQFYFSNRADIPGGFIFGPLMRFIQHTGEAPTAAFPSSHVSLCLILLWVCFRYDQQLFWFLIPFSVLLIFSTVYIRAHYVIDVVAAFLVTPPVFYFSYKLSGKFMTKSYH